MKKKNIELIELKVHHISEISKIHLTSLPNDFCSLLGEKFLNKIFYPELIKAISTRAYCLLSKKEVIGFVVFSIQHDFFKNLFFKHFFSFFILYIKKSYNPIFFIYIIEIFLLLFFRKNNNIENGYELVYIAMKKEWQNQGLAKLLVLKGLEIFKEEKKNCWLKTLTKTKYTIKFYESLGFKVYDQFLGRCYMNNSYLSF